MIQLREVYREPLNKVDDDDRVSTAAPGQVIRIAIPIVDIILYSLKCLSLPDIGIDVGEQVVVHIQKFPRGRRRQSPYYAQIRLGYQDLVLGLFHRGQPSMPHFDPPAERSVVGVRGVGKS